MLVSFDFSLLFSLGFCFVLFLLIVFSFEREIESIKSVGRELGRIQEELGKVKKHDQNIMCENIIKK